MRRFTRIFLVLTFALLQCAAPFAHAHVGGDVYGQQHPGQGFHIHEVQQQLEHLAMLQNGNTHAHAPDAPAVTTPNSKPRASVQHVFNFPLVDGYKTPRATQAPGILKSQSADASPSFPSPFRRQYPQGPPAL